MKLKKIDISEIKGFRLGNAEDAEAGTGVTVVIAEDSAVAGVDVRGGAPATRETDLLRSENTVEKINAVVLSGGSAFGLEAASGVMRSLAERGVGFRVGDVAVPIITGASLFDLQVGRSDVFPDVDMGRQAVENAYADNFEAGNHGAGTGASVGKMLGMDRAMKTGLGTFACGDDLIQVGAISAVNACADIYNGAGNIIAGLRSQGGTEIQGTVKVLKGMLHPESQPDLDIYDIRRMAEEESRTTAEPEPESTGNEKEDIARALMASYQLEQSQLADAEQAEETQEMAVTAEAPEPSYEQVEHPEDLYLQESYAAAEAPEAVPEKEPEPEPAAEPEPEASEVQPQEYAFEAEAAAESPEVIPEPEPEPAAAEPEPEAAEPEQTEAEVQPQECEAEAEEAADDEDDEFRLSPEDKADMGYDIAFNTTISCVITNAIITKSQANKLASILHDAYARAIKPVHTTLDGDTIFVMSTCTQEVNFDAFAALATDVLQYAIIDGAHSAESAYGLPAARDIIRK